MSRASQTLPPIQIDQHITEYGHEEIERARLEQKRVRLMQKKKEDLRGILKSRGQAVTGNKDVLIQRILGIEKKKNEKKIYNTATGKLLRRDVYEGKDIKNDGEPMEEEAFYHSRPQFLSFPFEEFSEYLEKVRETHIKKKQSAAEDDALVLKQLEFLEGMAEVDSRGFTCWRSHPGRKLLQEDVANNLHKQMKPNDLRLSRQEYWGLSKKEFRKRIYQEELRVKQNNLNEINWRKEDEVDSDYNSDWTSSDEEDDS